MSDSEISNIYSFDERRPELAPYGLTCVRWRPSLMRRPDRHNELEMNLLQSGTVTYLFSGCRVTVEPGHLTIFWALEPHQIIHFEGEGFYYVATIPFARFLQWPMPPAFLSQILTGTVLKETNADMAPLDEAMFDRWFHDVSSNSSEAVVIMMLEMEARLRRLALSYNLTPNRNIGAVTEGLSRAGRSISKVEQMAVFIATHYTEPILVREIGEAVDLHPDYANVLFRETFGMTLSEYVLEHRIAHAQRMLVTTNETITGISYASGFGSISRFNTTFKAVSGCTPTAYRRQNRLDKDHRVQGKP